MIAGFITGLVTANAAEWYIHKYILHEQGKKKDSFWRFHWADHHKHVYFNEFIDPDYEKTILEFWNPHSKEALSIIASAIVISPLLPVFPGFTTGLWTSMGWYYFVHKRSHEDPKWAYQYLPWHYDHHMARDQDKNRCVTFPLWDYVMGTRAPYIGTETEAKDIKRREKRSSKLTNKH